MTDRPGSDGQSARMRLGKGLLPSLGVLPLVFVFVLPR